MVTRWMEHREAEVKLIGLVSKLYGIIRFQNNILISKKTYIVAILIFYYNKVSY